MRGAIDNDGVGNRRYTLSNPIDPWMFEACLVKISKKEGPFHGIEGLYHVNFDGHMANLAFHFFHIVKNFLSQSGVILDKMTRDESRLARGDNTGKDGFESICENFCYDFIANVGQVDRRDLVRGREDALEVVLDLRDDGGLIYRPVIPIKFETLNCVSSLSNGSGSMKEFGVEVRGSEPGWAVNQDVLVWKNDIAGNFNTKSAWDCIRVRAPVLPWAHWIWHAILPKNISIMMWKATNNCLAVDEKIRLAVFEANLALGCDSFGCAHGFFKYLAGAVNFWFRRVGNSSYTRIIFDLIPSIVSWKLWARRCKARLEGKDDTSESVWSSIKYWICHLIKGSIKQLRLAKQDGDILRRLDIPVPHSPPEKVTMVKWIKPQQGWVKLNTDGSSLGNPGQSGAGGVIRDTSGHLCIAYSMDLGQGSNNYAELKGLLEGVRRCCRYGFLQVYIEVDSQLLVNWVTKGACNIWYLEDFWDELRVCLACLDYRLTHVFREGNAVADFLAKQGAGGLTRDWFDEKEDLPSQLRGLLRMDRIGLPYLRLLK
ncbi:hypothetical protein I3760_15G047900 [Carya illinoinensis]|nr:hypothetical protein I3760_15G047900 [Carya illinoinensis]